jgi:hypothetical protein
MVGSRSVAACWAKALRDFRHAWPSERTATGRPPTRSRREVASDSVAQGHCLASSRDRDETVTLGAGSNCSDIVLSRILVSQ